LDGWRGFAILLVLISHSQEGLKPPFGGHSLLKFGFHGVGLFFVISGYLITTRLLLEERINLVQFYVRRAFRLWPVAWTFLLCMVVFFVLNRISLLNPDFLGCLLFYRNYFMGPHTIRETGHFWSLSVEEQFYLVWPALLMLAGVRRSFWIAIAGFLSSSAILLCHWRFYNFDKHSFRTEAVAHALFCGCALAIVLREPRVRQWFAAHASFVFCLAIPILIIQAVLMPLVQSPVESICWSLLLAATINKPGAILQWKPLALLGTISYSVYIWQELLLYDFGWIGVALVIPISIASCALIEQPGIRLGASLIRRFARSGDLPRAAKAGQWRIDRWKSNDSRHDVSSAPRSACD
jgi:peptidoglycan/LPS O-acetylase OafA/YrhL